MDKDLMIYFDEEGVAKAYDDTYDITIHCESEEEQQKAIEQLKSLQWIPCSERLPFDAGYYLTTTTYNEVFCDYWNLNEWNRTGQVIAWMPLPEPYREDENE